MTPTPRTDARELAISIQNEDSCCDIYVKIDGKEYEGRLVDSDFARELECENERLRAALELAFSIPRMTDRQLAELIENCRKVIDSKP